MTDSKYAILFKSSDEVQCDRDPYSEKFDELGIKNQVISVLKFQFMNLDILKEKLKKTDNYEGLILVSPRCVQALRLTCEDMSSWRDRRIFVVGEKTAKLVEMELGLKTEGSASGNAKALAQYIVKQNILNALLLPTGNLSKEILPNILHENGIKLDQIIVYETVPDPGIEVAIKNAFDEHSIGYIMYFSPSAVDFTFPLLNKLGVNINDIKWGAIGPTTEEALKQRSLVASIVPDSPTPQHVAAALNRILKS